MNSLSHPSRIRALRVLASLIGLAVPGACASSGGTPPPSTPTAAAAVPLRPRPYPVVESPGFQRAVTRGTRTHTGVPGAQYWTQYTEYTLRATLDPALRRLTGEGTVRYRNRSPDTLRVVAVHLYQNLFRPGAARVTSVPVTGGMELGRIMARGRILPRVGDLDGTGSGPAYAVDGTIAWIRLPAALPPGEMTELTFEWAFTVPEDGAPRSGTDAQVFMLAYWYPQIAVYDDVNGWQTDQYLGNAEFYMGYADYDVALTVPHGWLIGATGELTNGADVLTPRTLARLAEVRRTAGAVHVVGENERVVGMSTTRSRDGLLTWRFRARNVRDFAFGASDQYLWDANVAVTGHTNAEGKPDTAIVHSLYRPDRIAWAWDQSSLYTRHAIEFLSRYLWPYPYPQMTALDGVISCSGMEYPMLTCIGGRRDTLALYSVTVHEFAHMWFPMQVGSDEKRHAWQDEGLTRFNQAQAMREYFHGYDLEANARAGYLALAAEGGEVDLMRHGDQYPVDAPAYAVASYQKMATILAALRELLGEETFLAAYREYGRRWLGKHPTPWDFWNTFTDVSHRDLSWFWRSWFFETWTLDHAVGAVTSAKGVTTITIEDRGLVPMPARVLITRAGGAQERAEVPVEVWLAGARRYTLRVRASPRIVKVEVDPSPAFPDAERRNNVWPM